MAELILVFKKQVIKRSPFVKDTMSIGRKPDNDIQIDNLAVSGRHAKIDRIGSDFVLTDLKSTNGTFVNNQKVSTCKLKHKDQIQIGKHIVLFNEREVDAIEEEEARSVGLILLQ